MTTQFTVDDMTCRPCVSRVATAPRRRDPQLQVGVDLMAGKVSVDGAAECGDDADVLATCATPLQRSWRCHVKPEIVR